MLNNKRMIRQFDRYREQFRAGGPARRRTMRRSDEILRKELEEINLSLLNMAQDKRDGNDIPPGQTSTWAKDFMRACEIESMLGIGLGNSRKEQGETCVLKVSLSKKI